jgi:hypothetical protein
MAIVLRTTVSILVRVCIWGLGFYKLEVHGALMSSLEFFLCGLWLSCCVLVFCLFDAINELHAMDDKIFTHFFIGK